MCLYSVPGAAVLFQDNEPQPASVSVMLANAPLAKASHMTKPSPCGWGTAQGVSGRRHGKSGTAYGAVCHVAFGCAAAGNGSGRGPGLDQSRLKGGKPSWEVHMAAHTSSTQLFNK